METKTKKAPAKAAAPVDNWEYKNRNYYLIGNKTPLTYTLPSRHSKRYPLVWFCLLYTSPSPRDRQKSRMPSSA